MPHPQELTFTYIGGPTALLEFGGLRLLTDPTFDPAGSEFSPNPLYSLKKNAGPALAPEALGRIDAVLLSHDHHFDNLDDSGRKLLAEAGKVFTTPDGAARLGGNAAGLAHWESVDLPAPEGRTLRITGTPARHGPRGGDRGPVTGFVLAFADRPDEAVYISGDTVWYEGVEEVARRFRVKLAVLFLGAAKVAVAGPCHLTMTAGEAVLAARLFADAAVVPVHFEGWKHFTQSRADIEAAFAAAGLSGRLTWPVPGEPTSLTL